MTSPSCDCAYSVIPTVALSPSFRTPSWLSANRMPLRSGIASPFSLFRVRPLVEGQRNHLGRGCCAANVDAKTRTRLGERRRDIGHPDVVAKRERNVPGGHGTSPLAVADDGVAMTRDAAIQHLEPHQPPRDACLAGTASRVAPDESLIEGHRPFQPRCERIVAGIHVVAVQAHPRL